ncbi:MAG: lysine biosynthesis protein LysX [Nitrososphaerota archaeon]|nr:lysine biosynthesis protein LysX [Nitrososphaerota archaeon]
MVTEKSVGILFDRIRWEEKELGRQLEMKGTSYDMIDAKAQVLPLDDSQFSTLPRKVLVRCVSFYRGLNVASVYEAHDIEAINSSSILDTCGNKLRTSQLLAKHGVPTPKTVVAYSSECAMQAMETIGFPCVMKPIVGSWGRQVVPIRDRETAEAMIEMRDQQSDSMQTIFYIQEMINRPPRDIRCIVVGDQLVASVYRYSAPENWKTNVALGGRTEACEITSELEETVLKAAGAVGKGVLGIDLMERSDSQLVVHEVNGTVEFKGAQMATSQSIAKLIVDYLLSHKEERAHKLKA